MKIFYIDENKLGFEFEGYFITEPTLDESTTREVCPCCYYGMTMEEIKIFQTWQFEIMQEVNA